MSAPGSEGARLHDGLLAVFAGLAPRIEGCRGEQRAGHVFVACPSLPFPGFHGVWAVDDSPAAAAGLEPALAEIDELGVRFWLQTIDGVHPALEAEAARLGLAPLERVPGMVATTAELAEADDAGLVIEPVEDEASLAVARSVAEAGFEVPAGTMAPLYTQAVIDVPGVTYYLGYAGGTPVSTALGFVHGDTVGIFNVGTPPEHRRRGYGAAITLRAAHDGFARGADLAWLQASQAGEPVYRRLGFRAVSTYTLYSRP